MTVVFEPVPPRRSPSRSPVAVACLSMGLIALAILKPWGAAPPGPARSAAEPRPSAGEQSPSASERATPRQVVPPPWVTDGGAQRLAVRRAVRPHDGWGIRVLVDGPVGVRPPGVPVGLIELWQPAAPPLPDGIASLGERSSDAVVFELRDRPVRFIGLTLPPDTDLRDVRLALERPLRRLQPVEVHVVEVVRRGQRFVVFGPWNAEAWEPGNYHVTVELPDVRTSITVAIRGATAG